MGELAALVAAFSWSASSVMLTSLGGRTAPAVLSALRLAFGSLVLIAVLVASGDFREYEQLGALTLTGLVLSGMLAYMVGDTIYIRALTTIGIQRTFPVVQALFIMLSVAGGIVLLDEPFTWGLVFGAILVGAGIYMVVIYRSRPASAPAAIEGGPEPPAVPVQPRASLAGYWLLLIVGITWSGATLLLAASKEDLGAIAAGTIRIPAGAVGLLLFTSLVQPEALKVPFRNRNHIGLIALTGALGTAFGSLLYVFAVIEAGAARTVLLNATAPLMAVPLSIIFLGERPTRAIGVGTVLCVLGVILIVA